MLNGDPLGPAPVLVSHSRSNSSHIWNTIKTRCIILWGAVTRKEVLLPAMFVFAWQATPSADSAMFFFQVCVCVGVGFSVLTRSRSLHSADAGLLTSRT